MQKWTKSSIFGGGVALIYVTIMSFIFGSFSRDPSGILRYTFQQIIIDYIIFLIIGISIGLIYTKIHSLSWPKWLQIASFFTIISSVANVLIVIGQVLTLPFSKSEPLYISILLLSPFSFFASFGIGMRNTPLPIGEVILILSITSILSIALYFILGAIIGWIINNSKKQK
ncbi:MAG: hypothetical protein ACI83O_000313 [Patescibacteria group bacterium]|jgi:hypothetical protein